MQVILIVEANGLQDQEIFENHLKKEGFLPIEGESFAYEGTATTHLFSTRAYILEVVGKGLQKAGFNGCKIVFEVGKNPMEAYLFNVSKNLFEAVDI
ncbi:MAG: hypothetical protein PHN18_06180 [Sulfurospirillaceae bacterium]|nr:hypothetical protein [Sulfurospirillaceae bacterium]MDD2825901.1 hypothetical protein [Sulfurospirillaceae bacterium]